MSTFELNSNGLELSEPVFFKEEKMFAQATQIANAMAVDLSRPARFLIVRRDMDPDHVEAMSIE